MAPRTSYPLPAQHPFGGMDTWRLLSLRAAASPDGDALPGQVIAACAAKLADFKVPHEVTVVAALPRSTISKVNKAALRTFLTSGDPLEQAERNWLAEAAADPSGDAP